MTRTEGLSIRDVLGLASQLTEQKRCKVCLILNDEALEEDEAEFRRYFEKIVDTTLNFAPSAVECSRIALDGHTELETIIAENCIRLNIRNIRLIKRIERTVNSIQTLLSEFDGQVLRKAVHSLTLLGWSVYEPISAPPPDFLKRRVSDSFGPMQNEKVSEKEGAWNALLDAYGFFVMDEFDLALLDGTRNGVFDPVKVREHANALQEGIRRAMAHDAWEKAWQAYHDSFSENEHQVLQMIDKSFSEDIQYRTPLDLNSTVWLLNKLGKPDLAAKMISQYVASRGEDRSGFNLDIYPFADKIDEPAVIRAFKDKYASLEDEQDPSEVLLSVAKRNGWGHKDISFLSTLSVDKYYTIFKKHSGEELHKIIHACLQFSELSDAPQLKEISRRATDALKRVGRESRINALRVRKYGVEVEFEEPAEEPAGQPDLH